MTSRPADRPVRRRLDLDASPTEVLTRLRGRDRLVALIGAWHHGEALIACDPVRLLETWDDVDLPEPPGPDRDGFGGGWIGAWGYRLGQQVERLPDGPPRPIPAPDHRVGFYDLVLRRTREGWWLESLGEPDPDRAESLLDAVRAPAEPATFTVGTFEMTPRPQQHRAAVARALDHIAAGDIFQVNLCARLEADFAGDPLDVFCIGVERLRPAYAAFVSSPDGDLVSFSPELFLRRTGAEVLTSPIKGTAPLSADPDELAASAKDRAENVMIVDLMRNDLGRVCVPGSVRVPALTRVERHAVWHLVSDVVGHVRRGTGDAELLHATFPPGSVTGAPKVRAMELIAELEATGREAYTGAIGHVSATAGLELNVVIRTFEFSRRGDHQRVWLGVGGGIVADSVPEDEYAECLVKARPLIEAIGGTLDLHADLPTASSAPALQIGPPHPGVDVDLGVFDTLLVIDGQPIDLDAHLARVDASVRAVYGTTIRAGLEDAVRARVADLTGRHRLRIDAVPAAGDVRVTLTTAPLGTPGRTEDSAFDPHADPECRILRPPAEPWSLVPRILPGGQGEHKWVDRDRLATTGHEPLLIDSDGSVLETARANLFLVLDDGLHTPALDGRLLPGTMRSHVIEVAGGLGLPVHQHRLTTSDLAGATEVFATNTLRGVVPVTWCEGVGSWPIGPITRRVADHVDERFCMRGPYGGQRQNPPSPPAGQKQNPASVHGRPNVLFVDNYDSFVFNLVQYVGELGATAHVVRNDEATAADLADGGFTHVVISPGPGTPADAGISAELVRLLGPTTPILGVCLGHQVIGEVFGGRVVRADRIVHGKASLVHHDGRGVFAGLPAPLVCARYHSLVVEDPPDVLEVTARTGAGTIMGLRHREWPVEGVQMHPESILTPRGHDLLANFLRQQPLSTA